jgi:hypothetical protein
MQENDFYVTLPSNGASAVYPRNHPTCYRTDLCVSRGLLTDWEVGLSQIQFTHNWDHPAPAFTFLAWIGRNDDYGQTHPEGYITSDLENRLLDIGAARVKAPSMDTRLITIAANNEWRHVDELGHAVARSIEEGFKNSGRNAGVTYERKAGGMTTFRARDRTGGLIVGMSSEDEEMFEILGITPRRESSELSNPLLKTYLFLDERPIPRNNGFADIETVFVYTDVCEEQVIGSHVANLLKAVPVTARRGERQGKDYERPTYVRVKPMNLRSIEIKLCDLTGTELQIWNPNSLVTVVLHFRKRRGHESEVGWY